MYNPMLDRPPEDYHGWLLRTDFRVGVQLQLLLSDPDLTDLDKTAAALDLLYGRGVPPDLGEALAGLRWFMACGDPDREEPGNESPLWSFDADAPRLCSAFRRVFGIDLTRDRLHWFRFVPMLADLDGTAFAHVLDIRRTRPDQVDTKRRAEFLRLQRRFALPEQFSQEESRVVAEVLEKVRGG